MATLPALPKLDTGRFKTIVARDPMQTLDNIKRTYGLSFDPIDRRAHDVAATVTGGATSYEVEETIAASDTGILQWIAEKLGLKHLLVNGLLLLFAVALGALILWAWFRKQSN